MDRYLNTKGLTSVPWDFTTFPSQQFKNDLGADLYQYALGSKDWDTVVKDTIANWASEEAALQ
jgi:raffinose/stachyose/melibiose transport system substrate-binding protein